MNTIFQSILTALTDSHYEIREFQGNSGKLIGAFIKGTETVFDYMPLEDYQTFLKQC